MVEGLDIFKEYFKEFTDSYVIIGGASCDYFLSDTGIGYRITKDLDIVILLEVIDEKFNSKLQSFITDGGYSNIRKSTRDKVFYRFNDPKKNEYPKMIELFSRKPSFLNIDKHQHIVPLSVEEEVNSLSAILLNDDYYDMIKGNCVTENNVTFIKKEFIIPLKARAYLDNRKMKESGNKIQENDIVKHKNDIFRIFQILSPETRINLPELAKRDLTNFIKAMENEKVDLKNLGIKNEKKTDILNMISRIYGL